MNPLTAWIARNMESFEDVENSMADRVAEHAVNSQRLYDERHGPSRKFQFWQHERRANSFLHRAVVNSSLKNSTASYACSFQAHDYYRNLAIQKRAQLLEEIENEKSAEN